MIIVSIETYIFLVRHAMYMIALTDIRLTYKKYELEIFSQIQKEDRLEEELEKM